MPDFTSKKTYIATAATVLLVISMQSTFASSDDAWDDYRHDVEQSCTKAATDMMKID